MTRKAPSGPKHSACYNHVPHTYTSNGWLCVDDEPGRAAVMVEFADHLAAVAALHHAGELERPVPIMTAKARKTAERIHRLAPGESSKPTEHRPTERGTCLVYHRCDYMPHDGSPNDDRRTTIRAQYLDAGGRCPACAWSYPGRPTVSGNDGADYHTAWSAPLVGPYEAEIGRLDTERPTLPADAFTPRTDWTPIRPAARNVTPAPEVSPVPTVQTVKARKTSTRHIHRTADGGAVFVGDTCAECGHTPIAQVEGYSDAVQESRILSSGRPSVPEYIGPADGPTAEVAPDPVTRADDGARFIPSLVPAVEAPISDAADTLLDGIAAAHNDVDILAAVDQYARPTIVPDARAEDDRPRCPRCGQTFRKHGTGAEWHRVNRPDCAAEYRRATA